LKGLKGAVTYTEWAIDKSKVGEWGLKALVTQKMLQHTVVMKHLLGNHMGKQIAEALIDNGHKPVMMDVWEEQDVSMRAIEYGSTVDTEQSDSPEAYVAVAYHCWQEEQTKRMNWEDKSLYQYIKWWSIRTFNNLFKKDKDEIS